MHCTIYRSSKKDDTYLYLEKEDDFSRVPDSLLKLLGRLERVMELELTPEHRLARADATQVREQLQRQGYYLQLPPKTY